MVGVRSLPHPPSQKERQALSTKVKQCIEVLEAQHHNLPGSSAQSNILMNM